MGKCFLGVGFGTAMALAYLGENMTRAGGNLGDCLSGMLEWVYIGGFMTACAIGGYALYQLCERWADRP